MSAVTPELTETISKLQNLPALSEFALGGGTNLALRYSHRISIDIDFLSPGISGKAGLERIISEIQELFGKNFIKSLLINETLGEQYMFLRMFLRTSNEIVKVEFIQNMKCLFEWEIIDGLRLINQADIGVFKLMSASNRFAKKDIYDLDFITDEIPLTALFDYLSEKRIRFNLPKHQSLFDLDTEKDIFEFPELLLEFDKLRTHNPGRPFHTHDRIDIMEGSRTWAEARINWRFKVRKFFSDLGKEFPGISGEDI